MDFYASTTSLTPHRRFLFRAAAATAAVFCLATVAAIGCAAPGDGTGLDPETLHFVVEMMAEEDSRPGPESLSALRVGLASEHAAVRRIAARGIGRLQRPELVAELSALLADPNPDVRAAVADAIAQSVYGRDSGEAGDILRGRLVEEADPATAGAVAAALGRLRPVSPAALAEAEAALVELSRQTTAAGMVGVARGLESLARLNARDAALTDATADRLIELATYGRGGAEGYVEPSGDSDADAVLAFEQARVRRLALAALAAARRVDPDTVETSLYDADDEVRRLAAIAAARVDDATLRQMLLQIALDDRSPRVRLEGLRGYARSLRATLGCEPIVAALEDGDPHMELQAIDLLAAGCRGPAGDSSLDAADTDASPALRLRQIADALPAPDDGSWHHAAHALVALANVDADATAGLLPAFVAHPTWQVRMYAARAAASIGALDTLRELGDDAHANVANAALRALPADDARTEAIAIRSLGGNDYQLLMAAAGALEESDSDDALPALFAALDRVTSQRRETSRDPRRAILARIGELGDADDAGRIRPYLEDFDPQIAEQASAVLLNWTTTAEPAAPRPLDPQPFPSLDELTRLREARAYVHMEGGGVIEIDLLPFEAPTNTARFARQAQSGYFEGLTFHRVEPNFVIQGASPGANEFMGDGPYSRDEILDRSHLRGTVGISTRGRDTGDSQIFVNLVDNVRLDHNFTIIGVVVDGMDVIDLLLEGATIERVTIEQEASGS